MRILTPIVSIIAFSVITNQFILTAMGKEKLILLSTTAGAVTNFLCNSFLIPRYAENGAAAATVLAETVVAVVCFRNASRFFDMRGIFRHFIQYVLAAVPIPLIDILVRKLNVNYIIQMGLIIVLSVGTYFLLLLAFKNPYLQQTLKRVIKR